MIELWSQHVTTMTCLTGLVLRFYLYVSKKRRVSSLLLTFILTTFLALTPQCDQSGSLWKVAFEQPFFADWPWFEDDTLIEESLSIRTPRL